jgi:MFS family permease
MYGLSLLPSAKGLWPIALGVIGLWGFIKWEMRVKAPVFDLNLFRKNRVFAFSNLAALINYSSTFALGFLLSLYLQYIKGLSPQISGFVLIAQPFMMAAFSPLAGRMSDRIEPRIVASIGMTLTALGLFLLALLKADSSLTFIILSQAILGFGFALFSSPNTNAVMSSIEKRFYGLASGSLGTMRVLGMMISMAVSTLLFALFMGRVQITPEYYPAFLKSVKIAFIIFGFLCLGGIFASLVRGKVHEAVAKETKLNSLKE